MRYKERSIPGLISTELREREREREREGDNPTKWVCVGAVTHDSPLHKANHQSSQLRGPAEKRLHSRLKRPARLSYVSARKRYRFSRALVRVDRGIETWL